MILIRNIKEKEESQMAWRDRVNVYNMNVVRPFKYMRQRHLTQIKGLTTSTTPLIRSWKSKHITQL